VRLDVGNLRVEDVAQCAFPQEDMTDYSHAFRVFIIRPHLSKSHHSCEVALELSEFFSDPLVGGAGVLTDSPEDLFVLLNEGNDGLAVVLGDVLCLIAGALPDFAAGRGGWSFLIFSPERFLLL
jgi:hypothetical protein